MVKNSCDAEISNLDNSSMVCQEHVVWLDITVQDALVVQVRQRHRHLHEPLHHRVLRDVPGQEASGESMARVPQLQVLKLLDAPVSLPELSDLVDEVAPFAIPHDDAQEASIRRNEGLSKVHDIWMLQHAQELHFLKRSFVLFFVRCVLDALHDVPTQYRH